MKKISAIGFDWGGVILQGIDVRFSDSSAEFLGIDGETFRRAYFLHNHWINKGADSRSFDQAVEMWTEILGELDMRDRVKPFMEFVRSRPKGEINQGIVELLRRLKSRGWKLGLLSNMSAENTARIRSNEFLSLFDAIQFSCEAGCMKPEPEAFEQFAAALDVPVDELVFIDDSPHSLSTAREVGYVPIHFVSNKQLVEELESLGIEM